MQNYTHARARRYDKVHTCVWGADEALTTPGRQWFVGHLDTARAGNITVGSIICADREFPEAARTLATKGAELILTPNACRLVPAQLRQFRTRAVENVLGVAMANYGGEGFAGQSVAYDHLGDVVAGPAGAPATILYASFNITSLREARATAGGRAQLAQGAQPELCQLERRPEFKRPNVFHRMAGSVV